MKTRIAPSRIWGEVKAPPSKSYTHRAIIVASLAAGESVIENPLLADDTMYTADACRALGASVERRGNSLVIKGTGGRIELRQEQIFVGNSASTFRMVAPIAAASPSRVVLDGDNRLRQRPMGDLLSALQGLGVHARSLNNDGCAPIEIQGGDFKASQVSLSGEVSSQPVSALLMAAPYTRKGLSIRINGGLASRPYIDVTLDVMQTFGVKVANRDYREFTVEGNQEYRARNYRIEGDYSSAAYFFAAGAIGGAPLTVTGLNATSVQGDRYLLDILKKMGASVTYAEDTVTVGGRDKLKGIDIDLSDYPDLVPALAAVAAFAEGRTRLNNIARLRFKESDRLNDTAAELNKMDIKTDVGTDNMVIYGSRPVGAAVASHDDHRLAMSLSIAALFAAGDSIVNGTEAVTKSYPRFFSDLTALGAKVEELA
ncbi:MAG: 3-phosphoshikimate 1-carboxyvinyltransferase [Dehalococcoidia bacterium]|jgi:3-phosphoshikimate 1-carboxyvinyltransferase